MALTDIKIKTAKVPEDKKQVKLADSGGLYLLVKPKGKYWRLDYRYLLRIDNEYSGSNYLTIIC